MLSISIYLKLKHKWCRRPPWVTVVCTAGAATLVAEETNEGVAASAT